MAVDVDKVRLMSILIVESNSQLGALWRRHLERSGHSVILVRSQDAAIAALMDSDISIIVLDVMLRDGSAFAVADYASYRFPQMKVIFVTSTTFFSDGSIFEHVPNACAFVRTDAPVDDLEAVIDHYAAKE